MAATDTPAQEEEEAILASIERFLERDVKPHVHKLEHDDVYPAEIVERMQELGLFGATIAADYGGLGLKTTVYAGIVERISRVWMSLCGIFNSHLIMSAAVERFGTEAQKRAFLPRFAAGELRGGLALTEPDCGTDLQAIRTVARRAGDHYVVNGTKTWISNGIHGHCFALLVKTDPAAEPRHKGHEPFPCREGRGLHGRPQAREARLQGHRFRRARLPGLPHPRRPPHRRRRGAAVSSMRSAGSSSAASTWRRAASAWRRRPSMRPSPTARCARPSASRSASIRPSSSSSRTWRQQVQAARLLTYDAARAYDRGQRCDMEAGMAKLFASEAAVKVSLEAMRIHGGYGYSKEFVVERLYRDAPLLVIGEGTNELQRLIIARQLVERNPV